MYHKRRNTAEMITHGIPRSPLHQACTDCQCLPVRLYLADYYRYLVSLFLEKIIGCDTYALRKLNLGAICLICLILYQILQYLHSSTSTVSTNKQQSSPENITEDRLSMLHAITALNISLFPPLFFFSGLYYTDVMSTLMVLATYYSFLKQRSTDSGFLGALITVVLGIVALLFRQTNIFWVAVFPAGLAIVDTLKGNSAVEPFIEDSENILERSWNDGRIYDVSVDDAGPTGMSDKVSR